MPGCPSWLPGRGGSVLPKRSIPILQRSARRRWQGSAAPALGQMERGWFDGEAVANERAWHTVNDGEMVLALEVLGRSRPPGARRVPARPPAARPAEPLSFTPCDAHCLLGTRLC